MCYMIRVQTQTSLTFLSVQVGKPKVGETCPSRVKADVKFSLSTRQMLRVEWESKCFSCSFSFVILFLV